MRFAQLAVTVLLTASLAGCVNGVADETQRGFPDGYDGVIDALTAEPFATWVGTRAQFTITTWGSSSCAPVATSVESTDDSSISVTFTPPTALICTADLGPTTHILATPPEIDTSGHVTVHVLMDYPTDELYELRLD
jgi:hypothetical protein